MKILQKALAVLMCFCIVFGMTALPVFAENDVNDEVITQDEPFEKKFTTPSNMRGTILTPSVDFIISEDGEITEQAVTDSISVTLDALTAIKLNTVLLNSTYDDSTFYSTETNPTAKADVLKIALSEIQQRGLNAYVLLDIGNILDNARLSSLETRDFLISEIHRFALKYACSGIILTDYYSAKSEFSFSEYKAKGAGIGYENWLYEMSRYYLETAADIIHQTDNTISVGIEISDMWANKASNELGSDTNNSLQALYDGFCDTKAIIEGNTFDFVTLKTYGSTLSTDLGFEAVTSWWSAVCEAAGVHLYIQHFNEKIGTIAYGWGAEDQLLRQLTLSKQLSSYGGCIFNSLSSLKANPLSSTDTLLKYFDEQINEEDLFEELKMTSPTSLVFTTKEPAVKFMGTFDSNFPVYFDGKEITLNEAGNFYFQKELAVGKNTFTVEHKDKTYIYSIERQVDPLQSIEQTKDIAVDGNTKLVLTAIAYSGAKVTATLNGKTVNLKEVKGSSEELDANSSYAKFKGYYRVADGIIGQEQSIGNIVIKSTFAGYSKEIIGGAVTINAEPEPEKAPDITVEIPVDQSDIGTGETVGKIDPVISSGAVKLVKVLNNYTTVYDAATSGLSFSPEFCQLPAGTLDYYKSTSGDFYVTTSGKRFRTSEATLIDGEAFGENKLTVLAVGTYNGESYIKIKLDKHTSFNAAPVVSYYSGIEGDYDVSDFAADKVSITFDNVTEITKLPSFEYNSVFSAGEWEAADVNGTPKFRLNLTLRQAGVYSGIGAYYDANGDLYITSKVITNSLSNATIVIDPGHGYGRFADVLDPGAIGGVTEQSVNLAVAKILTEKLTAMGANVIRLKTESEFLFTNDRPIYARSLGCDLYIALHCNSTTNTTPRGVEVYYYTPYSQPLAKQICDKLSSFYDNEVYNDGTNANRGARWSYYWVTIQQDFPSVLVEMGYISNEKECMVLANTAYQDRIADSIAQGVKAYFSRSSISYAQNGSDSAGTPEQTTPPETSDTPIITEPPQSSVPESDTTPEGTTVPEETTIPNETTIPEETTPEETTSGSEAFPWESGIPVD